MSTWSIKRNELQKGLPLSFLVANLVAFILTRRRLPLGGRQVTTKHSMKSNMHYVSPKLGGFTSRGSLLR